MKLSEITEPLGMSGQIRGDLDLLEAINRGLPVSAVGKVIDHGILSEQEFELLVVSRSVLAQRGPGRPVLTIEESDRLVRILRIHAMANEQFGTRAKASGWLRTPNRALEGRVPLDILNTSEGARVVETAIMRLAHGIFA